MDVRLRELYLLFRCYEVHKHCNIIICINYYKFVHPQNIYLYVSIVYLDVYLDSCT